MPRLTELYGLVQSPNFFEGVTLFLSGVIAGCVAVGIVQGVRCCFGRE